MKYYFICLCIIFFSCEKVDCSSLAESYRKPECLLIVKQINDSLSVYNFDIEGISLKTGNDTLYEEENRWFCTYYKDISIGDTIIKKRGELSFNIHKKDTILTYYWECEGKVYE